MPLEDALGLIQRNFEEYLKSPKSHGAGSEDFLLPDQRTSYLINLLADNRFLSIPELDIVLQYLTERKERMVRKQANPPTGKGNVIYLILTDLYSFKDKIYKRIK